MAWRAPTENDLKGSISATEIAAYRVAAADDEQTDPVTKKLDAVVTLVRGYIAAHAANTLGAEGTLPDGLIGPAMDYVAVDVIKRLPGRNVGEERSGARKAAIRLFETVAAGKFAIEQPIVESEEVIGSISPASSAPTRYFKNTQQDGI